MVGPFVLKGARLRSLSKAALPTSARLMPRTHGQALIFLRRKESQSHSTLKQSDWGGCTDSKRLWAEELGSYKGSWRLSGFLPQRAGNGLGKTQLKSGA